MLTLRFETDTAVIGGVYTKLGILQKISGANFVFYDGATAVGLWRMQIEDCIGVVDAIRFTQNIELADKNFFVRAMLYKLQIGGKIKLRVNGKHDELLLFGFSEVDGNMEIDSDNIDLHLCCKGNRH